MRSLAFQGSSLVEVSKRTVIGLALGVAFFLTGHSYANFDRTLKQYLGISCIFKNRFYGIIKLAYPHIKTIFNEMCSEKKEKMKELPDADLGSWKRAVVASDGLWQTKGHFSKNGSFVIENNMTGGLLWGKSCMKEQLNRWKVFHWMNVMSRQRSKAALLRWYGRMNIMHVANPHSMECTSATSAARKHEKYQHYSAETGANIGKYASENGYLKAINCFKDKLPRLMESTVLTFKQAYEKRLRVEKKKANKDATAITIPNENTHGWPLILRDLGIYGALLESVQKRRRAPGSEEHKIVCKRQGRLREKIAQRVSAVDQIDWEDGKKEQCKKFLTPEYTNSDESDLLEDEDGADVKRFFDQKLACEGTQVERTEGPSGPNVQKVIKATCA
ncbi:hypothetical protein ACROYT_G015107 [Oculina patagonica]